MSDDIPEELLVDILSRLPVKSLLRFRLVSKRWKTIISSPDLINTHLTNSSKRPSFMLSRINRNQAKIEHFTLHSDDRSVVDYVELDYPLGRRGMQHMIVGSCNGLLCLSDGQNTLLWNPSIRKYFNLPLPRFTTISYINWNVFFGFDLKAKDYKVLRMGHLFNTEDLNQLPAIIAEVYSLRIGHWESISSAVPSRCFNFLSLDQVYINGASHRIISKGFLESRPRHVLLSFDYGDEVFQLIDLPEEMSNSMIGSLPPGIRLLQNMVSVFQSQEMEHPYTLSIWVMREFGVAESWTKLYSFNFEGRLCDFYVSPSPFYCCSVENLALLNGSSWNVKASPCPSDFVLPTWLSKGCKGVAAKKNDIISITSVRGNLVEFLLTG